MTRKWLVGTNTAKSDGPAFKTKREAVEYGRAHIDGIFIVWKAELMQWEKEKNGALLRGSALLKDATAADVIKFAKARGYTLTEDDVLDIKRGSSLPVDLSQETIAEALDDYLNAFER